MLDEEADRRDRLHSKASPATLVVKCDKTLCPGGGISSYGLQVSLQGDGPSRLECTACSSKGVIRAGEEFCVDYVQSRRDGSGDTFLYLLLARTLARAAARASSARRPVAVTATPSGSRTSSVLPARRVRGVLGDQGQPEQREPDLVRAVRARSRNECCAQVRLRLAVPLRREQDEPEPRTRGAVVERSAPGVQRLVGTGEGVGVPTGEDGPPPPPSARSPAPVSDPGVRSEPPPGVLELAHGQVVAVGARAHPSLLPRRQSDQLLVLDRARDPQRRPAAAGTASAKRPWRTRSSAWL